MKKKQYYIRFLRFKGNLQVLELLYEKLHIRQINSRRLKVKNFCYTRFKDIFFKIQTFTHIMTRTVETRKDVLFNTQHHSTALINWT